MNGGFRLSTVPAILYNVHVDRLQNYKHVPDFGTYTYEYSRPVLPPPPPHDTLHPRYIAPVLV